MDKKEEGEERKGKKEGRGREGKIMDRVCQLSEVKNKYINQV